jgi:hypothetical protein
MRTPPNALVKSLPLRATDAGTAFEKVQSGVTTSLENVACTLNGLVVVVGQAGVILRSTDDGAFLRRKGCRPAHTPAFFETSETWRSKVQG